MRLLYLTTIALLCLTCTKEELPEFTTVKPKYPVEGYYTGEINAHCNTFSYDVRSKTFDVYITAFDGEKLAVQNNLGVGIAYLNQNMYYNHIEILDVTDCGQRVAIQFQGTGILTGDTLVENGTFILYHNNKSHNGTYHIKTLRQ